MLTLLTNLPDNVLGVTGEGKITVRDYETLLIPAIEDKLKRNKKIRLLYNLSGKFKGFELNALVDDARIGMKHFFSWDKIALVSDDKAMNGIAKFFGYMVPCEMKIFRNTELEEAKRWITGD